MVLEQRVAVLVDGDNISSTLASKIVKIANGAGRPDTLRVYTNARISTGWHDAIGYRLIHAGAGKNASDLLLAIDAMELALRGEFNSFVIASSDGDFVHLAQRLRELGRTVIGIGEKKAPPAFRQACHRFTEVSGASNTIGSAAIEPATATTLDQDIRRVIAAHSKKGEGILITELARRMHTGFNVKISTHPERTWRAYLSARDKLYDLDPRGPNAKVRFKPSGFPAK